MAEKGRTGCWRVEAGCSRSSCAAQGEAHWHRQRCEPPVPPPLHPHPPGRLVAAPAPTEAGKACWRTATARHSCPCPGSSAAWMPPAGRYGLGPTPPPAAPPRQATGLHACCRRAQPGRLTHRRSVLRTVGANPAKSAALMRRRNPVSSPSCRVSQRILDLCDPRQWARCVVPRLRYYTAWREK
jgi:hypothetical protein